MTKIKNWMKEYYKDYLDDSNCLIMSDLAVEAIDIFGVNFEQEEDIYNLAADVQTELFENGKINE